MDAIVKIDGEPLAKVAISLIEKISSAAGWMVNRDTPNKIAVRGYIESINKSDLSPIEKAAFISNANKIIKEYCNQKNIVRYAINALDSKAMPENVDDDWILQFMDKARLISDESIQMMWGKILKEECTNANSMPKALIHILARMDRRDAEIFTNICSLSAYYIEGGQKKYFPLISNIYDDEFYTNMGITYSSLSDLQSLGLLQIDFSTSNGSYQLHSASRPINVYYFDEIFTVKDDKDYFLCGNVVYTKPGQALCRTIDAMKCEGFFCKYGIPILKSNGEEWIDEIFNN